MQTFVESYITDAEAEYITDTEASPTQQTWAEQLQEIVEDRGAWRAAVHGVAESDMT